MKRGKERGNKKGGEGKCERKGRTGRREGDKGEEKGKEGKGRREGEGRNFVQL